MTDQERLAEYSKYIDKLETDLCILAAEIEERDRLIQRWLDCAMVDPLMEGPRLKGWNRSALNRLWQEAQPGSSERGEG